MVNGMNGPGDALGVDSRLLGRPSAYNGGETEWDDWAFQFRAYVDATEQNGGDLLEQTEARADIVDNDTLTEPARNFSVKLYFMLAMLLRGPALLDLKRVRRGSGLEA